MTAGSFGLALDALHRVVGYQQTHLVDGDLVELHEAGRLVDAFLDL